MLHNMGVNFEISKCKYSGFSLGDNYPSTLAIFSLHPKTDVKELLSVLLVRSVVQNTF